MPYATKTNIIDRHGQDMLDNLAFRDGVEPDSVIAQALDDASAEIDSHLGARYTLPLKSVPGILVIFCVDIAIYNMATGTLLSEDIKDRYKRATKALELIASGKARIGAETTSENSGSPSPEIIEGPFHDAPFNTQRLM